MPRQLHHYVPQFYLRRFVVGPDDERIWVYERGKDEPDLRPLSHIAAQTDYYAIRRDGSKDQRLEQVLGRIESTAAPLLSELSNRKGSLSKEQKEAFALFVAIGQTRVPRFRSAVEQLAATLAERHMTELASNPDAFAAAIREIEASSGERIDNPEEVRQSYLRGEFLISTRPEFSLKSMLEMATFTANIILQMRWAFMEADPSVPLVTSDSPVVGNNPTMLPGGGPPTPAGLEINFPISPRSLFVATWHGRPRAGTMRPGLCRQVNKLMALTAERYVYSSTGLCPESCGKARRRSPAELV